MKHIPGEVAFGIEALMRSGSAAMMTLNIFPISVRGAAIHPQCLEQPRDPVSIPLMFLPAAYGRKLGNRCPPSNR